MSQWSPSRPRRRRQRSAGAVAGATMFVVSVGLDQTRPALAAWTQPPFANAATGALVLRRAVAGTDVATLDMRLTR